MSASVATGAKPTANPSVSSCALIFTARPPRRRLRVRQMARAVQPQLSASWRSQGCQDGGNSPANRQAARVWNWQEDDRSGSAPPSVARQTTQLRSRSAVQPAERRSPPRDSVAWMNWPRELHHRHALVEPNWARLPVPVCAVGLVHTLAQEGRDVEVGLAENRLTAGVKLAPPVRKQDGVAQEIIHILKRR